MPSKNWSLDLAGIMTLSAETDRCAFSMVTDRCIIFHHRNALFFISLSYLNMKMKATEVESFVAYPYQGS